MVGSLGDIIFKVTANKISTFDNLNETNSSKWEVHNTLKQEQEFIISELSKCTFLIPTNIKSGTSPEVTYDLLEKYCSSGQVVSFILNGKKFRGKTYIIRSFKTNNKLINNFGQIMSADYEVELEEFGGDKKIDFNIDSNQKTKNTYTKQSSKKNNIDYSTGGTY